MEKVFVGTGQLNINHTIASVNFDAEDQFYNIDLSNDTVINIDKEVLNSKLGSFDNNVWENNSFTIELNEIKSLVLSDTDIHNLGSINGVNLLYRDFVKNTFFRPESLYNDEDWINNYDTNFNKQTFINLVQTAESGQFTMNNINSLFELWRNSGVNNYNNNEGFISGHYLYFPAGISLLYSNDFRDNTSNTQVGSISYNKNFNLVFKII
tara:strand:- start:1202 stop:1831 length:630 start_codon:yes stop_codon:yes gene_type:complete